MQIRDNKFERKFILITCCNYMAKVDCTWENLTDNLFENNLPPPPLQNAVLIPKNWKVLQNNTEKVQNDDSNIQNEVLEETFNMNHKFLDDKNKSDINFKIAKLENSKIDVCR